MITNIDSLVEVRSLAHAEVNSIIQNHSTNHTRTTGTIGDLYMAVANKAMGTAMKEFPSAHKELSGLFS